MDEEIQAIRRVITDAKAEHKALATTLASLQSTQTTHDIREAVHELQLRKQELLERLVPLRSGNLSPISREERQAVEQAWREAHGDLKKRRAIWMEFSVILHDNLPPETDLFVSCASLYQGLEVGMLSPDRTGLCQRVWRAALGRVK